LSNSPKRSNDFRSARIAGYTKAHGKEGTTRRPSCASPAAGPCSDPQPRTLGRFLFYRPIIEKLVARRHELGISQNELDMRIGVAFGHVGKWECGMRSPAPHSLMLWCQALGLEIELKVAAHV
jgi:Helix-turn-helix